MRFFGSLVARLFGGPKADESVPVKESSWSESVNDEALLELTYGYTWHRPGDSRIVNGLVNIGYFREGGNGPWHWGAAHTHSYGTSVIGNELRSILEDPAGTHSIELTLQHDASPSLFDDGEPSGILFRYTAGPKVGRAFRFAPVKGDEDGWSEMVAYAQQLIDNDAVQRICQRDNIMAT